MRCCTIAAPLDRRTVIRYAPRRLALTLAAIATGIGLTLAATGPGSTYADGGSEMISVRPTAAPTAHRKVKVVATPTPAAWTAVTRGDGTWD